MDSVSQKQNYLSLTGIDELSEATANIEELQKEVARLQEEVDNNVSPNFVTTDNVDQVVNGNKAFIKPVRVTGLIPFYDSATKTTLDIVFESKKITDKEYKLIYNPLKGVKINGPLDLDDNTLKMSNIRELASTLLDLKNNSVTTGPLFAQKADISGVLTTFQANVREQLVAASITTPLITATTYVSGTVKIEAGKVAATEVVADKIRASNSTKNGQLFADIAQINSTLTVTGDCDARKYLMGGVNLINVTIPFVPSLQRTMSAPPLTTSQPVSFFNGINNALAGNYTTAHAQYAMTRYRHPFSYQITRISVMYDSPALIPTANTTNTIVLQTFSGDGVTADAASVTVQFTVTPTIRCDTANVLFTVPFQKSLGALHFFGPATPATAFKGCQYILHGYQVL